MNSIQVCLPASVTLSDVAGVLKQTLEIEDLSAVGGWSAQVNVLGERTVYVTPFDLRDPAVSEDWPGLVRQLIGEFAAYDFASSDFARVCAAVEPVVRAWPAIIDDDAGHLVSGESFLAWLARHPRASWMDVYEDGVFGGGDLRTWQEMPVLATYTGDS